MKDRVALVTGSNRGIGLATVKELLQKGYEVILTSRKVKDGLDLLPHLEKYGNLHYHQLDVSSPDSIENIFQYVSEKFGRLDILINNAGINYDRWQNSLNADLTQAKDTFETNLFGAWRMCMTFLPMMQKHNYGRIVNVSSGSGSLTRMAGGTPVYAMTKAAMNVLSIKLAVDLEGYDILVNSVCPGWVRTDMGGMDADRSPEKGAETIVWAAELPTNGPGGKFFRDKNEIGW